MSYSCFLAAVLILLATVKLSAAVGVAVDRLTEVELRETLEKNQFVLVLYCEYAFSSVQIEACLLAQLARCLLGDRFGNLKPSLLIPTTSSSSSSTCIYGGMSVCCHGSNSMNTATS